MIKHIVFVYLVAIVCSVNVHASSVTAAYYQNQSQYWPPVGGRPKFDLMMIQPDLLTDLYYAFAIFGYVSHAVDPTRPHMTGDFTIQPTDPKDKTDLYPLAQRLKATSKNGLKLWLCIGGWGFNDPKDPQGIGPHTYRLFSTMVSNYSHRQQFINSAISYAHLYGFDGIDIDWEYPGDITRGGNPEDFDHFLQFLKEAASAFRTAQPPLMLSISSPAVAPSGIPKGLFNNQNAYYQWIAQCASYLDRINIMAYDYHGPFDEPRVTGVNAPLNRDSSPQSILYIERTLQSYLQGGVPANKMVLGIPAYGHSYAGVNGLSAKNNGPLNPFEKAGEPGPSTRTRGLLSYYEIADMIAMKKLSFGVDIHTNTAHAYDILRGEWISFDTPDTVELKVNKASQHGLAGVICWSIDMDEYHWDPKFPILRKMGILNY